MRLKNSTEQMKVKIKESTTPEKFHIVGEIDKKKWVDNNGKDN